MSDQITDTAKPDRAAAIDTCIRPEVRELLALDPLTYAGAGAILSRVLNQRDRLERERNTAEWERAELVNTLTAQTTAYNAAVDEREELRARVATLTAALEAACPLLFHTANGQRRTPLDEEQARAAFRQARAALD